MGSFESHLWQLIFLWKKKELSGCGCVMLYCVALFVVVFGLPPHLINGSATPDITGILQSTLGLGHVQKV